MEGPGGYTIPSLVRLLMKLLRQLLVEPRLSEGVGGRKVTRMSRRRLQLLQTCGQARQGERRCW